MAWTEFVNGTTADADEVNADFSITNLSKYSKYYTDALEAREAGLHIFANGTDWQTAAKTSADGGATWSAGGFGDDGYVSSSGVYGITNDKTGTKMRFTVDSGVTWTNASSGATLPGCNDAWQLHLFNSTIGVVGGYSAGGNKVAAWYTSDGGDNWTQSATGPDGAAGGRAYSIQMASATVGYLLENDGDIWKTTDAGVNWADTGDNCGISSDIEPQGTTMVCLSTDTLIQTVSENTGECRVIHYTNSTNTVRILYQSTQGIAAADNSWFGRNFVTADNGNIYWLCSSREHRAYFLFKWDGTHLSSRWLNQIYDGNPRDEVNLGVVGDLLYANIPLYSGTYNQIIEIDVRGE